MSDTAAPFSNAPADAPHVLIVEDEQVLLKFLVFHLEQAGYRNTAVSAGGDMMPIVESVPVDLILLDLGLPDGDGLTWAQRIRETTDVPMIVLTPAAGRRRPGHGAGARRRRLPDQTVRPARPRPTRLPTTRRWTSR